MRMGLCKAKLVLGFIALISVFSIYFQGSEVQYQVYANLHFQDELTGWFIVFNLGLLAAIISNICSALNAAWVLGAIIRKREKIVSYNILSLVAGGIDIIISFPTIIYFMLYIANTQTNAISVQLTEQLMLSKQVLVILITVMIMCEFINMVICSAAIKLKNEQA